MAGSPSHPPYLQAGREAANDSGLDLPLEKESPVLAPSTVGQSGPQGIDVEGDETVSPLGAEHEVKVKPITMRLERFLSVPDVRRRRFGSWQRFVSDPGIHCVQRISHLNTGQSPTRL